MTAIPNSISLVTIAPDAEVLSADHRNNYAAIQTAINGILSLLSGGSSGQVLTASDPTDAGWASTASLPTGAAGQVLTYPAGVATAVTPASVQAIPADPTGTNNSTGLMMGLAVAITPVFSGRLLIVASGGVKSSAVPQACPIKLFYGTSTAPANGDAITGTQVGKTQTVATTAATFPTAFSIQGSVTGLAVGTAVWIDLSAANSSGGTTSPANLQLTAVEY